MLLGYINKCIYRSVSKTLRKCKEVNNGDLKALAAHVGKHIAQDAAKAIDNWVPGNQSRKCGLLEFQDQRAWAQNVWSLTGFHERMLFKYFYISNLVADELRMSPSTTRLCLRDNREYYEVQSRGLFCRVGNKGRREALWLWTVEEVFGKRSFKFGRELKLPDGERLNFE